MTADLVSLAELPELGDDAMRPDARPRLDEWPARLQGVVEPAGTTPPVVAPADAEGVSAVVRWANDAGARVQPLGLGSNVVGAVDPEVDLLVSLERIADIEVDDVDQTVSVGAGCDGLTLESALEQRGLTLGHYPQSLHVSTVGGWVATRATGTYSAYHGGIERLLVGVEYVDPRGEIVRVAPRPRASGGLDLLGLLCGSEGSLGIVTRAMLQVARRHAERRCCAAFGDLAAGLAAQRELSQSGLPLGLVRLYNAAESRHVAEPGALREDECLLVVTTLGAAPVADAAAGVAAEAIAAAGGRALAESAADPWFANRYAGFGFMAERNLDPTRIFDTIEVALPWSTAAACAAELEASLGELSRPLYLHFSHVYATGVCLYAILFAEGEDPAQAQARWTAAWAATLDIAARRGGTLAHHHGIGALRAKRYARTPEADLHRRIAAACDPRGVLAAPLIDREPVGADRA